MKGKYESGQKKKNWQKKEERQNKKVKRTSCPHSNQSYMFCWFFFFFFFWCACVPRPQINTIYIIPVSKKGLKKSSHSQFNRMNSFRAFQLSLSEAFPWVSPFLHILLNSTHADHIFTGICPGGQRWEHRGFMQISVTCLQLRPPRLNLPQGLW